MLQLRDADVCYGAAQALHGVSVDIGRGDVLALVGRNGAGKSTLLKTLCGWLPLKAGTLTLHGNDVSELTPEFASRHGIAYVPDNRQVFPTLTVEENMRMAQIVRRGSKWTFARVFSLFPRLAERRAAYGGALSGGEQQMLAIARALLCDPDVLLLDEPTEGLAPVMVDVLVEAMASIVAEGVSILLVEQNMRVPRLLAKRCVVLDSGRVGWRGTVRDFESNEVVSRLLSV